MKKSLAEYKQIYKNSDNFSGWDFSKIKVKTQGTKWDFYKEVVKKSKIPSILLDIGTGGGEKILKISSLLSSVVAIDNSDEMINTAQRNLQKSRVQNVRFYKMDAHKISFPDNFFDLISCRQSDFDPLEVYRILRPGGCFITQQVSEADKKNIKEAFNRGQNWGEPDGENHDYYLREFKAIGFSRIESYDYNAIEWYEEPADLIYLLRNTPLIPDFGKNDKDFEILHDFILANREEKGIRTNSKRYMLVVEK